MTVIKKTITAKAPGLGTVQVDNKEWVKVDKDKMESTKVGDTLEVSDVKKETQVAAPAATVEAEKAPVIRANKGAPYRASYGQALSEYDLHKDRQIQVSGIVQALIQSPLLMSLDQLETAARKALDVVKKLSEEK